MKKAIIEASFGTSYTNALDNSVLALQKRFKEDFADYDVFTVISMIFWNSFRIDGK